MPDPVGFFTDTTVCIGCKACQVACHQWNDLPAGKGKTTPLPVLSGNSYDNTTSFSDVNWRHVKFIEQTPKDGRVAWLMMSDVCKHCRRAGCLEVCPTGALVRTEFESVYVQPDVCNGCGYCVVGCPFGVINRRQDDGRAWKCTLCYDRQKAGLEPACAKACPTDSILFGELDELRLCARKRLAELKKAGVTEAYLYGMTEEDQPGTEGLHAFFLLLDRPEVYNLPPQPVAPTMKSALGWVSMALGAAGMVAAALAAVGKGGRR
jgi:formate dehydrogenase iron-sulfur subunit